MLKELRDLVFCSFIMYVVLQLKCPSELASVLHTVCRRPALNFIEPACF